MPETASPSKLLIVTDVFGNTPAVAGLLRQLAVPAIVVAPFSSEAMSFRSEQEAYQAFIVEGGVARYANKVADVLRAHQADIRYAVGFSAGASALWINSDSDVMSHLQSAVLFYGSRIRDYRQIQPLCPMRLIFAEQEAAFEPAELVRDLRQRGHVADIAKNTLHGFMNPYSRGSCVKSQAQYTAELIELLHGKRILNAA